MKYSSYSRRLAVLAHTVVFLYGPATAFAQAGAASAAHPFAPSRPIPGRYIVVFKSGVANPATEAASLMQGPGGQLHHTYAHALKGFSASLPDAVLKAILNNPNVSHVEQDQTVALTQVVSPQNQATWGLDRIDQADRPLDTQYQFTGTGAGVNAFIIDTGIRTSHVEFTGRLLAGYDVVGDGRGTWDCNGHGTHVAGTVGGTTWGVAKGTSVIPVRVLDCTGAGSWSGVIAGIDWVAASPLRPAVANLSLGGGASAAVDAAVAGAVGKGVTMVVAAGNSNADACTASPAREPIAITVGATTSADARASYSNYGACVDIFAPGSSIMSAWYSAFDATNTLSGTSMASPHVAGAAALILAANPTVTPAAVATKLISGATPSRLTGTGAGSPNLLVNSLGTGGNSPNAPTPVNLTVAYKSMVGSAAKTGGSSWKAAALVTVRDVNTGAAVMNATVGGTFSPGGSGTCLTGTNGNCTLTSGAIKASTSSASNFSGTNIAGTLMTYDASQNTVSQIVIVKP